MEVRVERQRARPGVEHRGDSELAAETGRVAAEGEQGLRGARNKRANTRRRLRYASGRSAAGRVKTTWK